MLNTTVHSLVIAITTLTGLYSFWSSCKKDGFDQEKALDLVILGLLGGGAIGVVTGIIISWAVVVNFANINPFSVLFGFVGTVSFVVLKWKWSLYRVLDNLAVALTLLAGFWLLTQNLVGQFKPIYLIASLLLFVIYALLQKYRLLVLKSGFTFCLTCGVFCLASALSSPKFVNLIFIGLLFTLTLTVLIFRVRSLYGRTKKNGSTPVNA